MDGATGGDASAAFVVLIDGMCACALARLMESVEDSDALVTIHPDGRVVFSGGRRQISNDMRWWCSVRAHHQGPPIRAPLSFVVGIGQLGRWCGSYWPILTKPDLVLRYPASPGRTDIGFESRQRGAHDAATLVGISRVAADSDAAAFFAGAAPSLMAHGVAAPPSMRSQLSYAASCADWIFVYPEAVVVAGKEGDDNDTGDAMLWPSRWILAGPRESNDFMLFRDRGARTPDALALVDVPRHREHQVGCASGRRRRRRRRPMDGKDAYVRALLTLPAELRYAIVTLLVRAWMPTVGATSCLADLASWMSAQAPIARHWEEFRRACRKVYAERASAYTVRRRIGPALQLHREDIRSLDACLGVFRSNTSSESPDLWKEPRLTLWRPGARPIASVAGASHPEADRDPSLAFYVVYAAKSAQGPG